MAQARRKQQEQDPPEEERLEEEEQGDDPEAEGSFEENGTGVNISIEGDHITVELQRDGTEGETLHRIGDLVDGL